ncbi:hypothetical protein ATPR_0461 [Acetobacter tropicalis NBRC 101654]|uniref:Uncharacterized protein n=1 Tax=Acetobacter tropicalis NBRC 101654 TaxID=749388 RepID=F7VAR2_9PROT|nr:hypothetical protein ATPR_0461 [Acetobacter tropicalis NBRC 101654]
MLPAGRRPTDRKQVTAWPHKTFLLHDFPKISAIMNWWPLCASSLMP